MGLSLWRAHHRHTQYVRQMRVPNGRQSKNLFEQAALAAPHRYLELVAYKALMGTNHHLIRLLLCVSHPEIGHPIKS